jgi:membrane protein DedA with SNARE-associated domain
VGYFIPGVRHLTAYAAGIAEVAPHQFAVFAYTGSVLWVSTFLGLGYLLGDRWEAVEKNIHYYLVWVAVAIVALAAGYVVWRKWGRRK